MDNKNNHTKIRIGITHGDINGVGYEVILKSFSDARMFDICTPILYGSSKVASYHKKMLTIPDYPFNIIKDIHDFSEKKFNILNIIKEEVKIDIGKSTKIGGELALKALNLACDDIKNGNIEALVTAPINKKNIQSETFKFPGHTEYLTQKFGSPDTLMMMVCNKIRIGILTSHLPLKEVPKVVTKELLMKKIEVMNESLKSDFGISMPKIAVLALNPHAGDNGVNGDEDQKIVIPAVNQCFEKGILVYGSYPADGFFGSSEFNHFDGVLALYHDQGLIPFKLMSFTDGVNYTAGLPFVRTSPAHGTGYEIAGKNIACEQSFRNAIYLACDIIKNRKEYVELTKNPLKKVTPAQEEIEN